MGCRPRRSSTTLAAVLADAPPLPGEEARYAQVLAVLEAARRPGAQGGDDRRREGSRRTARQAAAAVPQLRPAAAAPLEHDLQRGRFGTDYFTRTAVAKSNIFVNAPNETKYFYQDLDASGARLNGANRYNVTFAKEQTPPVHGFWSLTLYNEHHFFAPNAINRYSLGTKNKDLQPTDDGSLTIYVQADEPPRINAPTGCRHRPARTSRSTCGRTGRRWQSPMARGLRRPCSWRRQGPGT